MSQKYLSMKTDRAKQRKHHDYNDSMDDSQFSFTKPSIDDEFNAIQTPPEDHKRSKGRNQIQCGTSNQQMKQNDYGKSSLVDPLAKATTGLSSMCRMKSSQSIKRNQPFTANTIKVNMRAEKAKKSRKMHNKAFVDEFMALDYADCNGLGITPHQKFNGNPNKASVLSFKKMNSGKGGNPRRRAGATVFPGNSLMNYSIPKKIAVNDPIESTPDSAQSKNAVYDLNITSHPRYFESEGSLNETIAAVTNSFSGENAWSSNTNKERISEEVKDVYKESCTQRKKRKTYGNKSKEVKSNGIDPSKFHTKSQTIQLTYKSSHYDEDEEYIATNIKHNKSQPMRPRRSPRTRNKKDDVIDLLSSDDETSISYMTDEDNDLKRAIEKSKEDIRSKRKLPGSRAELDVARIAIGKRVFSTGCILKIQTGTREPRFILSYKTGDSNSIVTEHKVLLEDDTLAEFQYFVSHESVPYDDQDNDQDDDNQLPFFALRVSPNDDNELNKYSNSYTQGGNNGEEDTKKWYIVIEFRSDDSLNKTLEICRKHVSQLRLFLEDSCRLSSNSTSKYTTALKDDDIKSAKMRTRKSKRKKRSSANTIDNEIILVYPFDGNESSIEFAANGLSEINKFEQKQEVESSACFSIYNANKKEKKEHPSMSVCTSERSHFLTIREEDMDRLEHGEYLNDTLVDFWMQWIWRKEPAHSKVHFFSSHFYSTLRSNGVESVKTWTHKKGINIFTKSFIFIPINESLHWSLCVVVNPYGILSEVNKTDSSTNELIDSDDEVPDDEEDEIPCLLFLDSLRAHRSSAVARNIREWLFYEWQRLNNVDKNEVKVARKQKFSALAIPMISPKIPYQTNGWDCGVFLCRYAYALYTRYLNGWRIKRKDLVKKRYLNDQVITKSAEFDFGMPEIGILRDEMKTLVRNLSEAFKKTRNEKGSNLVD